MASEPAAETSRRLVELSREEAEAWVAALQPAALAAHAETFGLAGVDGELLCNLTADDLASEELGV